MRAVRVQRADEADITTGQWLKQWDWDYAGLSGFIAELEEGRDSS